MLSCGDKATIAIMPSSPSHADNDAADKDFSARLLPRARSWYFTKDEIDNHSPSRKDGIDRVRESSLRKSYCSFLKDLGMRLRVSPVTTATAMMFCHRFYMRQSHARNDWQTIATACMFLACKAEDNLRPLRDAVLVAYEIIYKWDPSASERIRQRDVYYKHKQLILDAEHLLLVTIAFDIGIQHPFRPLVDALKRLNISNNDVAKASWNLVNEWLRTTLCLQYKPHYIAAASLSVAARLLHFRLPMYEGKAWWLQFDVSPKQLEEVTQQMLRYFKHDEKQKVPLMTTAKVADSSGHSTQSCVMSELTTGSDPMVDKTKSRHLTVKEPSEYQSSDCCSGISVVDSENAHTSTNISHMDDTLGKIDVDRLKRAFERTRHLRYAKNKAVILAETEVDRNVFLEKQLEEGVELEYLASIKKQKVSRD